MKRRFSAAIFFLLLVFGILTSCFAGDFRVGTSSGDITPPEPTALWGQFHIRFGKTAPRPLTANVAAIESGDSRVTLVSLDLLQLPEAFIEAVCQAVTKKDASIPTNSIILAATHTHTSPVLTAGKGQTSADLPGFPTDGSLMTVEKTVEFLADRISDEIVKAWKNLVPAKMTYGLDRNSIGFGRRVNYADGRGQMYGPTNTPDFRSLEGMDDDDVSTMFFTDQNGKLLAILVNVACPSQVVEGRSEINADYWHFVRQNLRARYGDSLVVLGMCSAAGDLSPRPLVQKQANERMRRLRGINEKEELARRIDISVAQTWDAVQKEMCEPIVKHQCLNLDLPLLKFSEAQLQGIKNQYEHFCRLAENPETAAQAFMGKAWCKNCLDRYERLQKDPNAAYPVKVHIVRIGETVICTNPFELFTEYGIRMKARSAAAQTFIVQLCGNGTYLATERGIAAGHYSAIPQSCACSPEAGQLMVDETVKAVQEIFK